MSSGRVLSCRSDRHIGITVIRELLVIKVDQPDSEVGCPPCCKHLLPRLSAQHRFCHNLCGRQEGRRVRRKRRIWVHRRGGKYHVGALRVGRRSVLDLPRHACRENEYRHHGHQVPTHERHNLAKAHALCSIESPLLEQVFKRRIPPWKPVLAPSVPTSAVSRRSVAPGDRCWAAPQPAPTMGIQGFPARVVRMSSSCLEMPIHAAPASAATIWTLSRTVGRRSGPDGSRRLYSGGTVIHYACLSGCEQPADD